MRRGNNNPANSGSSRGASDNGNQRGNQGGNRGGRNNQTNHPQKTNDSQPQASGRGGNNQGGGRGGNRNDAEDVVKLTNAARKRILQLHSIGVNVADIHRIVQNEIQKEARYYDVYAAVKVAKNAEVVEA
jgi:hypothetical protein